MSTSTPPKERDPESSPAPGTKTIWGKLAAPPATYQNFDESLSDTLTAAFDALRFRSGPAQISAGGLEFDFLSQECWDPSRPDSDSARVRFKVVSGAGGAPFSVLPRDEHAQLVASAEDSKLLDSEHACGMWIWWPASWPRYKDDKEYPKVSWQLYPQQQSDAIEAGFQEWVKAGSPDSGPSTVCKIDGFYEAVFSHELHTQRKTREPQRKRPIRRVRFLWLWNSGGGNIGDPIVWTPFSKEISATIEAALMAREAAAKYVVDGKNYRVSLTEMCQFREESLYNRRDVRRIGAPLTADHLKSVKIAGSLHSFDSHIPSYWSQMKVLTSPIPLVVKLDLTTPEAKNLISFMNSNMKKHGDKYGVVSGIRKDPQYFEVVDIARIQTGEKWRW